LIALTVSGNPYPVTEPPNKDNPTSLVGQASKIGYQSHYLEATQRGQPAINVAERYGDELVVFEGSQTLPLFLVYTSEFGGGQVTSTVTEKKPADEATGPKGWSFLTQILGDVGEVGAGDNSVTFQGETIIFGWIGSLTHLCCFVEQMV